MITTTTAPFSALLRARTASAHAEAESAPFLLALAEGRVTTAGVTGLLERLLPVYTALEELIGTWSADPAVQPFLVPGLERSPALRADLERLGGTTRTGSEVALAYAARVREVGAISARAYVAHHYTRYLGDLSGGQIIAHALRAAHGLELAFLTFPDLRGPAVKRGYREQLDALPWNAEQQEEAVLEADLAFRFNQDLAGELEGEIAVAGGTR